MSGMNETLERMKSLYTYGQELNEGNNVKTCTLERHEIAADGKFYGIIRECNKYYIKSAQKGQELMAESYDYIGGFNNKKDYEYTSYANASKQLDLKLASINEACEGKVNMESLEPFHNNNQIMTEASQGMKDELARVRQIMYNAAMIMNESSIPTPTISRANDTVMYNGKNPEAETGKTGAKPEGATEGKATLDKDFKTKTNGVDKKVAPFDQNATASKDQLKEGDDCGCNGGDCKKEKFGCDWGSNGMGKGQDPATIGWDMEGQQTVNEEENDWGSEGLPSTPGVGEADTDHNNDPFNKSVNESDDFDAEGSDDVEGSDVTDAEGGADIDAGLDTDGGADIDADTDTDLEGGDGIDGDAADLDTDADDDTLNADTDIEGDADLDTDLDGNDDIEAKIDELQAQIDALKAELEGSDDTDSDFDAEGDEFGTDTDSDFDAEGDDFGAEGDDFSTEGDDFGTDSDFDAEGDDFSASDDNFDAEGDDTVSNDDTFDSDVDECGAGGCDYNLPNVNNMAESKRRQMNRIVEMVVKDIMKEDVLHDFGNHPGYRKKPFDLPPTGSDKTEHGRDWNDASVHNEKPFGSEKGKSDPFTILVDSITKDVMAKLKSSDDEGEKKN